jgi:sterol desaturase/sphingolipid hydroxylase (fatty acid hydroxylase superfamily)
MDYPEPTLYAIPFFVGSMLVEAFLLKRGSNPEPRRDTHPADMLPPRGYERADTRASLLVGLGSLVFVTPLNMAIFWLAGRAYDHRLWTLGPAAGWVAALIGWDFLFYWHHRAEHRIRILWACHVNHHSSQHFNLSTALRQPWTPHASIFFYPLLGFIGVPPALVMVSAGLNLIYQFWVHTEVVRRMPRWFEFIMNTPSHHRVHHASNKRYIDKNYAGVLIVWDRVFGTFEEEQEPVVFGLTKNIGTFNPIKIAFHEYLDAGREVLRARSLRDVWRALFAPPA